MKQFEFTLDDEEEKPSVRSASNPLSRWLFLSSAITTGVTLGIVAACLILALTLRYYVRETVKDIFRELPKKSHVYIDPARDLC